MPPDLALLFGVTSDPPPLILTAGLDAGTFALLDGLRRRHFPAKRNVVPAHVTLFHLLPGDREREIVATLRELAATTAPPPVELPGVRFLGKGVAVEVRSPGLVRVRDGLAGAWGEWLGRQDHQPYKPHATVQNKVDPAVARALYERLKSDWEQAAGRVEKLLLWRYLGGPWEAAGEFRFQGTEVHAGV